VPKSVTNAPQIRAPASGFWVRIRPQQIAQQPFVGHLRKWVEKDKEEEEEERRRLAQLDHLLMYLPGDRIRESVRVRNNHLDTI